MVVPTEEPHLAEPSQPLTGAMPPAEEPHNRLPTNRDSGRMRASGSKLNARGSRRVTLAIEEGQQLCVFWIGVECYALDVVFVSETVALPEICTIPAAPKELLGMVNLRGTALAVVDLAAILEIPGADDSSAIEQGAMSVLILSPELIFAGLRIGRVDSIAPYRLDQLLKINAHDASHASIIGVIKLEGRAGSVTVLNGEYLLERLKAIRDSFRAR